MQDTKQTVSDLINGKKHISELTTDQLKEVIDYLDEKKDESFLSLQEDYLHEEVLKLYNFVMPSNMEVHADGSIKQVEVEVEDTEVKPIPTSTKEKEQIRKDVNNDSMSFWCSKELKQFKSALTYLTEQRINFLVNFVEIVEPKEKKLVKVYTIGFLSNESAKKFNNEFVKKHNSKPFKLF